MGVNLQQTLSGLEYITKALQNGIPIMVGIDDEAGSPNGDKSTDHFVVVVAMGTDEHGKYLQFYDNASGYSQQGTNPANKLYFNEKTGLISGQSQTSYVQGSEHDYILTQIRESKKL